MAKKSFARMKKRAEEARMKKVMYALETLGAAYCKETDILPTEACLKVKPDEKTGELMYWFTHYKDRIDMQEAHPDVEALFGVANALCIARKGKDQELLDEALDALETFMKRYEEPADAGTP